MKGICEDESPDGDILDVLQIKSKPVAVTKKRGRPKKQIFLFSIKALFETWLIVASIKIFPIEAGI